MLKYLPLLLLLTSLLYSPTLTLNANQITYNQIHVYGTDTYINPFIEIRLYHDFNNSIYGSEIIHIIVHTNSTNQYSGIILLPNTVLTGYYFIVINKPVSIKVEIYIATPVTFISSIKS